MSTYRMSPLYIYIGARDVSDHVITSLTSDTTELAYVVNGNPYRSDIILNMNHVTQQLSLICLWLNISDNTPSFTNLPDTVNINAATPSGTSIFDVTFTDIDTDDVSTLAVSMVSNADYSFDGSTCKSSFIASSIYLYMYNEPILPLNLDLTIVYSL